LSYVERLLNALLLGVPSNEGIEDGEYVAPIFDHTIENVAEFRVAFGIAMPLQKDRGRYLNIAAELLGRVPPKEEPVKKRRFPLGEGEVCGDFYGNDLCNRGHKEKCSLPKSASASSGTVDWMSPAGQRALRAPVLEHSVDQAFGSIQRQGCQAILTAVGCCKVRQSFTVRVASVRSHHWGS
jgi:hypothetical protein